MTGIERLRDVCKALKGSPWCGTDVATIGGEPAYEKLRKIAEQIERETLPRPRFENGEPVQVGDKYVNKYGNIATADTVVVSNHGFTLYDKGSATHFKLTDRVKRPEEPDSWERVEKDAAKSVCGYFDREGVSCRTETECPARNSDSCSKFKAGDIVRRCKALAGVE